MVKARLESLRNLEIIMEQKIQERDSLLSKGRNVDTAGTIFF